MKKIMFAFMIMLTSSLVFSQNGALTYEISNDTVLEGNYFIVKFTLSNLDGKIETPDFEDFDVVGGPMSSSMMSIVNGKSKKESSYVYYLKPKSIGIAIIGPAKVKSGNNELTTEAISITTLPNPSQKVIKPSLKSDKDDNIIFFGPNEDNIQQPSDSKKKLNVKRI